MRGRPTARERSGPQARRSRAAARTDYTGAVYGSVLAASVIAGADPLGHLPLLELVAILLVTAVVFWAAHVYAGLVGERLMEQPLTWQECRRVAARELPIIEAAVPPAVAVAISPLLGLGLMGAVWFALAVAVAEQIGWASAALIRVGASGGVVARAAVVNLLFGLVIVVAKAALPH